MSQEVDSSSLHEAVGGTAAWRELAVAFYSRVERDPVLRPLFPGKTLRCAIEEFTAFLVQVFGGPAADSQHRWWLSLRESHLRFRIRPKERAAWLKNMVEALDDVHVEEPVRSALYAFFEKSSAHVVNNGESLLGATGPAEPTADAIQREISSRWETQLALDEAAEAIRKGDAGRAIAIAESSILVVRFKGDRTTLVGLLALMIGSRDPAMLRYVEEKIRTDPALVRERYADRTLLHSAAAHGTLGLVEVLLELGSDPNVKDGGGHTPLYCLANECRHPEGASVVRALARCGANLNANDGVKRCTALHMAARRGNLEVAEALLDCGADMEARDSFGDTPLRRSVNCDRTRVASLLLSMGADGHSKGSRGLTPLLAARSSEMTQLLRTRGRG